MTNAWIAAFVVLASLVLVLGLVVLGLVRRITPLLEESQELIASAARRLTIGGLPPGSTVPPFSAGEVGGGVFTQHDLRDEPSVVLFVDDECVACERLVADLRAGLAPELSARLVVVSSAHQSAEQLARSNHVTVIVDDERTVARAFESVVSPQAFVVDDEVLVRTSGTPNTWDEMRKLVEHARGGGRRSTITAASIALSNAKEVTR